MKHFDPYHFNCESRELALHRTRCCPRFAQLQYKDIDLPACIWLRATSNPPVQGLLFAPLDRPCDQHRQPLRNTLIRLDLKTVCKRL